MFSLCHQQNFTDRKRHKKIGALPSLAILTLLRVARRWNQTGQKHAGSSDISKDFLQRYPSILWSLVIVAYLIIFLRLSNRTFRRAGREVAFVFAFAVMASALAFKFAFAAQDTPELIPSDLVPVAEWLEDVPLVNLARATFSAIFVGILYTISFELPKSVPYSMLALNRLSF
jgi:ethanolaminephosphotransferase